MKIGMVTSVPLVPPWDQGDKNLAYGLTGALPHIHFQVLTTRRGPAPCGANLELQPLYRTRRPSLAQKMRVYTWYLLADHHAAPDLYHMVYQPVGLSSRLMKWLPEFRRRPMLHTVPATTEGHLLHPSLFLADRIVALSQYGCQALRAAGLRNVVHIPQGIEVAGWTKLYDQKSELKSRLGAQDKQVLLYPGHYGAAYGLRVLVEALPQILALVPEALVILACRPRSRRDPQRRQELQHEISRLGMNHAVRFLDTVHDMRALIGASDLVVLPFLTMRDKVDIPTSLLEALAAGTPVVISDIPPMSELVTREGSALHADSVGLVVPPGDAQALARAVVILLRDEGLRTDMAQRGQTLAHERFDIRQVAHRYEELYRELVR